MSIGVSLHCPPRAELVQGGTAMVDKRNVLRNLRDRVLDGSFMMLIVLALIVGSQMPNL